MGASLKCTAVIVVSTCVLIATLAIGVTVPRESSRTGIVLAFGLGDLDRNCTGLGARGRQRRRLVKKPRASTATPIRASAAPQ